MVYFSDDLIRIPCHFATKSSEFTLTNELSGETIALEIEDVSTDDRYYEIDLRNLEIRNGTYEYRIGKDCGLFQVGDYVPTGNIEYDERKQNVVYER